MRPPPNAVQIGRLRRLLQGKVPTKNLQWPKPEGAKCPARYNHIATLTNLQQSFIVTLALFCVQVGPTKSPYLMVLVNITEPKT